MSDPQSDSKIEATLPFHNRVALVFDFDQTLAEDSFTALLRHLGLDPEGFERERIAPRVETGWEQQLARAAALAELAREGHTITRDTLREVGETITLYPEVEHLFGRVCAAVAEVMPETEVEFYVLSGGFADIIRGTSIAEEFDAIYGCELHYGDDGNVAFARKLLPSSMKPLYLMQISQGMREHAGNPADVYRDPDIDRLHVPLRQMIYAGDGASDMAAFGLMTDHNGVAIGVTAPDGDGHNWRHRDEMRSARRVVNLAPARFEEDSELMRSLQFAVGAICRRLALRALGHGE